MHESHVLICFDKTPRVQSHGHRHARVNKSIVGLGVADSSCCASGSRAFVSIIITMLLLCFFMQAAFLCFRVFIPLLSAIFTERV